MTLIHIDTHRFYGGRNLLLVQTTDSDGGGVIESLYGELKKVVRICVLYRIIKFCLHSLLDIRIPFSSMQDYIKQISNNIP